MSHNLSAVLGSLLVDGHFRKSMMGLQKYDRMAILKAHGFFMSRGEQEVFARMMESFEAGKLDEACNQVRSECPDWPCSWFTFDD